MEFWDEYWTKYKLPCLVNINFSFDRTLSYTFKKILKKDSSKTIFEIGCAPGKWLLFFKEEFSYEVFGLEYSAVGVEKTLKNFDLSNMKPGHVYEGDFFNIQPDRQFDIVISLGFIEHFDDVESVVEKHLQWLKQGGYLILGVPNFRGINYFIQKILNEDIIKKHNIKIMDKTYFENLTQQFPLSLEFLEYCCFFEPALFIPRKGKKNLSIFFARAFLLLMRKVRGVHYGDRFNHRLFSSYLVAMYRKGDK